jgi:two-component system phosphate regulon sensor histidine kinase PhoR
MLKQKKLSDMKTDFINNMTHELKTPLTTIAVASSSLADPSIHFNEDRVVEISRMIGKQNRHLNQLIDHILDIELWERDQISLTRQPVEISRFLKEKVDEFKLEHANDSIKITEEFNLKGVKVLMDEFQFTRVVYNLLSNAVKYSLGKPEIVVKAEMNEKLVIKVQDNGIGMDKETQNNIFSRFYRANTGNLHKVKGLGLGLYYVKKIVEAHGGQISVNSKPNHGSTFIIELPQ